MYHCRTASVYTFSKIRALLELSRDLLSEFNVKQLLATVLIVYGLILDLDTVENDMLLAGEFARDEFSDMVTKTCWPHFCILLTFL